MIRHIELIKVSEVKDGKYRAEQLDEIVAALNEMLATVEGVESHLVDTAASLDPINADLMLMIDFADKDAAEEYDISVERLAVAVRMAEYAESMLAYEYEL